MKNKKIIIALLVIFVIFATVLGIIIYKRFSPNTYDKVDVPNQPQYAINDVKTDEDSEDTGKESQESQTYILDNITISNIVSTINRYDSHKTCVIFYALR